MELQDVVDIMSVDRFVTEYRRVIVRIDTFNDMLRKYESMSSNYRGRDLEFKPEHAYEILETQLSLMLACKSTLEEIAEIEDIELLKK